MRTRRWWNGAITCKSKTLCVQRAEDYTREIDSGSGGPRVVYESDGVFVDIVDIVDIVAACC